MQSTGSVDDGVERHEDAVSKLDLNNSNLTNLATNIVKGPKSTSDAIEKQLGKLVKSKKMQVSNENEVKVKEEKLLILEHGILQYVLSRLKVALEHW